jgi:hypothetical protein
MAETLTGSLGTVFTIAETSLTGSEIVAALGNAKSTASLLTAIGASSDQIAALAGSNNPNASNVVATMDDLPDGVTYGSTAGTATEGNDSRLPDTDQKAALSGTSGTPSASNPYATKATTDAETTARSSGDALALKIASNLSDLNNATTARSNLGLGTASVTDSTAYATSAQGALADTALQSDDITGMVTGSGTAGRVSFWSGTSTVSSDANLYYDATSDRLGIGTSGPLARVHVVGNGLTSADPTGYTATDQSRSQTIGVQGDGFAYLVAYDSTNSVTFASGVSTNGNVFVGSITEDDVELRRGNVAKATLNSVGLNLPNLTASRALVSDASKNVMASAVTSTELGYVHGVTSAIQPQFAAKAPLASPALTGIPTAPTASSGTSNTQLATTAFSQRLKRRYGGHTGPLVAHRNYLSAASWLSSTSAADNNWYSVCWSPELGLFCAVAASGVGNRVMTSPDGINWTIRTSAADNGWLSVCWSPELGLFCAVAIDGAGNRVMTSISAWSMSYRTT